MILGWLVAALSLTLVFSTLQSVYWVRQYYSKNPILFHFEVVCKKPLKKVRLVTPKYDWQLFSDSWALDEDSTYEAHSKVASPRGTPEQQMDSELRLQEGALPLANPNTVDTEVVH